MCILGTVVPYYAFISWLLEYGFDVSMFLTEIVNSGLSIFAWTDVLLSAVVLIYFINREGRKLGMQNLAIPLLGTCLVGVSLGLPAFLLLREYSVTQSRE